MTKVEREYFKLLGLLVLFPYFNVTDKVIEVVEYLQEFPEWFTIEQTTKEGDEKKSFSVHPTEKLIKELTNGRKSKEDS